MKPITIILIFCACFKLHAQQNLVPNPSFEEYVNCPSSGFYIDTSLSLTQNQTVKHWFSRTLTKPRYFNSCATNHNWSVPMHVTGYQMPKSGEAYMLLNLRSGTLNSLRNNNNYNREYLTSKLFNGLSKDSDYYVFFYVSLHNRSMLPPPHEHCGITSSIGVWFSDSIFFQSNNLALNVSPQIQNPLNRFLTDTQNWMKVSGVFKAKGGEQYLTIGNFLDDINTPLQFQFLNLLDSNKNTTVVYYIDDVNVFQLPFKSTTLDTAICNGGHIIIPSRTYADSSIWNDGIKSNNRTFTQSGKWWLNCYLDGEIVASDTLVLTVLQPDGLHTDTTICHGQNIKLTANPSQAYLWSNGANTPSISISTPGLYWVEHIVNNCVLIDSFDVQLQNFSSLPPLTDTSFCKGSSIYIGHLTQPDYQFTWLPSHEQSRSLQVFLSGQYVLKIDSAQCTAYDTIIVNENSLPLILLNPDTVVCFSDLNQIALDAGAFESYLWEPTGETTRTVYATEAMLYLLTVTDTNGCKNSLKVSVDEACAEALYFPNVFTPNGDGINDVYEIKGATQKVQDFSIQIYNRWGVLEYSSSDVNQKWEAHHSSDGVYILIAQYKLNGMLNRVNLNITVLR